MSMMDYTLEQGERQVPLDDELERNALLDAAEFWDAELRASVDELKDKVAELVARVLPRRVLRCAFTRLVAESAVIAIRDGRFPRSHAQDILNVWEQGGTR